MNTVHPIKDIRKLTKLKKVLKEQSHRNWLLLVLGINTALRISDLLSLQVSDLMDGNKPKQSLVVKEQKTNKSRVVYLNKAIQSALRECHTAGVFEGSKWVFPSRKGNAPISRYQAHRILSQAAKQVGIVDPISCHSLRKTAGYHLFKSGTPMPMLMKMLNHSSQASTMRYLGLEQEDINQAYANLNL
jgi:integrase